MSVKQGGTPSNRARIRRGPSAPRKRVTSTPARNPRNLPVRQSSASRALAVIPAPMQARIRRGGNYALGFLMIGLVVAGVVAMRLPQMIGIELGEAIGRAGFAVNRIEIRGISKMDRARVYDVALEQQSRAMPLVDLNAMRDRLLRFGWIADARVSRRLPDTLVVDVVERKPAAIWQYQHKLSLVDEQGIVIAPVSLDAMPENLPVVIGPAANRQVGTLDALLTAAPSLRPMLAGASWIGERRWDIRFQSGETLALPEGDVEARRALVEFASRDQRARLLGQGFVRFDMRVPGRIVVRSSDEPGRQIADPPVAEKII
jgi:cell division protein FtsQ